VYHLSGTGTATWAEFAEAILRAYPVPGREHVRIAPIATSQFPTPARRPVYSVMDSSKLRAAFGVALPSWPEQLSLALSHTPRAS
jgi:dTDP-4-dehydrorhamnose reductase